MNHQQGPIDPERDHLAPTGLTWADVRDRLRKALSNPPREYRVLSLGELRLPCGSCGQPGKCALYGCARTEMIPPTQLPRMPQPVSFLRWCGQPAVHSSHGRCDGVK